MIYLRTVVATFALFARCALGQKYVFAHVVVGNTAAHSQSTWENDITLAMDSGIDAFALNCGYPDSNIPTQVANAFAAAEALAASGSNFKLFFSFDYLGGGETWPATGSNSVASYLNQYVSTTAYFKFQGIPFVSTFEGTGNIADWAQGGPIRSAAGNLYFVPDWTSLGPSGISSYLNNIEGFFSWDMWPEGATNKTDSSDLAWQAATPGKTYMMGVSPWFFHSGDGTPDWVWRGDDLWADRWSQTLAVNPEFIEIVTWNDFGESHYIGPIRDESEIHAGSAIYVEGSPHDSWRDFLPYYIAKYKGSTFDITTDQMQYWYHTAPTAGGSTCGVVGNDPDYQTQLSPNVIVEDGIFFSALLMSDAVVAVQVGNYPAVSYSGSQGINHWSQPFDGQTGAPKFSIIRNGAVVSSATGTPITPSTSLSNGCTNYNAWVGSFQGPGQNLP